MRKKDKGEDGIDSKTQTSGTAEPKNGRLMTPERPFGSFIRYLDISVPPLRHLVVRTLQGYTYEAFTENFGPFSLPGRTKELI